MAFVVFFPPFGLCFFGFVFVILFFFRMHRVRDFSRFLMSDEIDNNGRQVQSFCLKEVDGRYTIGWGVQSEIIIRYLHTVHSAVYYLVPAVYTVQGWIFRQIVTYSISWNHCANVTISIICIWANGNCDRLSTKSNKIRLNLRISAYRTVGSMDKSNRCSCNFSWIISRYVQSQANHHNYEIQSIFLLLFVLFYLSITQ